ncbi:caspase family protein [Spirosoma panaciterrae]|uniref:caspase family protein n=1 Tax=Spirosoma panaciterrae TaxID=496058 RepID=UPI000374D290|nr:caspase family protein [Spirosoma panaciterrae]
MHLSTLIRFIFWLFVIPTFLNAQQPKLMLPIGHTSWVNSALFSLDGNRILTASWDNTAKVWDTNTGILLLDLKGHTDQVNTACFNADGKRILTASDDKTAKVWDAASGKLLINLIGHTDKVNTALFSLDGSRILTASRDNTAKVWDAATGKLLINLIGHTNWVLSARYSPNGKQIITASTDKIVKVWDATTGKLLINLIGHTQLSNSIQFSPDGNRILTASWDKTAKVWDATTGTMLLDLKGHNNWVHTAYFSTDGKRILTASRDKTAKVWDAASGNLLLDLKGHKYWVKSALFSPDGKRILTASEDSTAKVWDAATGNLLLDLKGHTRGVNSAHFSADGKQILTASADHTAKVWDANTGSMLLDLKGHFASVTSPFFSPDGKPILTTSDNKTAKVWDATTGTMLLDLKGHTNWVTSVYFSADGKRILTASWDKTAKLWDATTGTMLLDLKGHTNRISSAQFSPDGNRILTVSEDKTAKVWDANTGSMLLDLKGNNSWAWRNTTHFSADGKRILTASEENTARVWDATTGTLLLNLTGHTSGINSTQFSTDGSRILTASSDHTAKVWDATTGTRLLDLKEHTNSVNSAFFSADGKQILTASLDNTAKLWDATTGALLLNLPGHTNWVNTALFSPDGSRILTASSDHTAIVWDAATGTRLLDLKGHTNSVNSAFFSADGKQILTASLDNTCKLWNANTGEPFYTFFAVKSTDYLLVDKDGRYDGTEGARKLVYYMCGDEVIELDQFKELGWQPNLAAKIMGLDSIGIKAKGINELDICGRTPQIEERDKKKDGFYQYLIRPGKGGVGQVMVSVNGKVVKTIPVGSLRKVVGGYFLSIAEKELSSYFVSGQSNQISIKVSTADQGLYSRGVVFSNEAKTQQPVNAPNVYLVSIGISDYKGERLRLGFAAKDAQDFSGALAGAARALLNIDGKEHVQIYTFSTASDDKNQPFKGDIVRAFAAIKDQATADDILVVFLAGHGVVSNNQFYFLTADASALDINGVEEQVAISTAELDSYLRDIKAQKQLLILDACNSGQALASMQKLLAIRAIPDDQRKALERLKDRTGTFILTASASNQAAYEASRYEQGLLTYSLLYGMQSGNGLRNNYVDVSTWFNSAADHVKTLAREIGGRQDPETMGRASFDVGLVTEAVKSSIVLSSGKKFFSRSKFYIDADLQNDDEKIAELTDKVLIELSAKGKESPLAYVADNTGAESYSIRGRYKITGNAIVIKYNLIKGNKERVNSDEIKGTIDAKEQLVKQLVEQVKRSL